MVQIGSASYRVKKGKMGFSRQCRIVVSVGFWGHWQWLPVDKDKTRTIRVNKSGMSLFGHRKITVQTNVCTARLSLMALFVWYIVF